MFEIRHFIGGHHRINQYAATARITINDLSEPTGNREIRTMKEKKFHSIEEADRRSCCARNDQNTPQKIQHGS